MMNLLIAMALLIGGSEGRVYGFSVDIVAVQGQADVSRVDTRQIGTFHVADTQHCGKPQIGTAYLQYVRLENADEYMTLFSGTCAYEAW